MKIYILGLGAGSLDFISKKAYELLKNRSILKIFRTQRHNIVEELKNENIEFKTLDYIYEKEDSFESVYDEITKVVIENAKKNNEIIYAVPGNPFVTEDTTNKIISNAIENNIDIEIIPSVSFIDASICAIKIDPTKKLYVTDVFNIDKSSINPKNNILISQVYDRFKASELKLLLMEKYDDEQIVKIIKSAGNKDENVKSVKLYQMDYKENEYNHLTSIFIESVDNKKYNDIGDLREILKKLRSSTGCPWDKKQNFNTMTKYVIEEANEVVEAIKNNDMDNLLEELGDLLFEVIFLTTLAEEKELFCFEEVVDNIVKKMIRRHPHVFSDLDLDDEDIEKLWSQIKNIEKQPKKS